jgi:hypothetical protein
MCIQERVHQLWVRMLGLHLLLCKSVPPVWSSCPLAREFPRGFDKYRVSRTVTSGAQKCEVVGGQVGRLRDAGVCN